MPSIACILMWRPDWTPIWQLDPFAAFLYRYSNASTFSWFYSKLRSNDFFSTKYFLLLIFICYPLLWVKNTCHTPIVIHLISIISCSDTFDGCCKSQFSIQNVQHTYERNAKQVNISSTSKQTDTHTRQFIIQTYLRLRIKWPKWLSWWLFACVPEQRNILFY